LDFEYYNRTRIVVLARLFERLPMKISIFTMNGGHGTISASMTLRSYLRNRGAECSVVDFMKETNPLGNVLAEIYNYLLRKDLRFASYYMEVAHHFPFDTFEPAYIFSRKRILNLLEREKSDVLVLICPWIISSVLRTLQGKKNERPRVYTIVVDLGRGISASWFNPAADFTSLPTQKAMDFLRQFGLREDAAAVMGMPLTLEIQEPPSQPEYLQDIEKPLCTVLGGREGGRNSLKIVDLLLKKRLDMNILIQCGRNKSLKRAASRRKGITIIGFPQSLIPLFQKSYVVITKPGALTISELIALKKNFILDTSPVVMPQERGNVEFVWEENCGLIARRLEEIPSMVKTVLEHRPEFTYPLIYGTTQIGEFILKGK
jgi:processive 1,2-diacylglycerol beta-glucosyltransferase